MDAYRTICSAPPPEIRHECKAVRGLNIRTEYQACYRAVRIVACIEYPVMIKAILCSTHGANSFTPIAAGAIPAPSPEAHEPVGKSKDLNDCG